MEQEKEQKINDVMNEIVEFLFQFKNPQRKLIVFNSIKKCMIEDEGCFNLDLICEFCKKFGEYIEYDITDLIQEIIDSYSAKHNYLIAKNLKNLDASKKIAHEKIVIENEDPKYCYWYARDVKGANIKDLEKVVLNAESAEYSYWFAKEVCGASIDEHRKVVIKSKDPEYNFLFANDIPFVFRQNIYDHVQAIIDSEDIEYCIKSIFDLSINDTLAESMYYLATAKKDSRLCYILAKKIHRLDNALLGKAAMEDDNKKNCAEYNYRFALEVANADIEGHGKAVISSGDAEYNYRFAKDIFGADIKAHGDVVLASENDEYNFAFARDIEGADIIAHLGMCGSKRDSERQTFCELSKQANGIQKIKKLIFALNKEKK